jgi:peptidoglycan/LPS O-acetylase OafA/YrhL
VLLDLVRGLAAVLVLFEHWRNLLFVDYPQLTSHRILLTIPYLISSAGHQSVMIFFVLSGYLISGSVFRSFSRDRWSWGNYLNHRAVRLWVVLLPGLLLCALWDNLGIHLGHAPGLYGGMVQNHIVSDVGPKLVPTVFFGNLFFVQGILSPTFGSDGALWSLANEFWYYLLFPLGLIALRRQFPILQRVIYGTLFLGVAYFVRGDILLLFPVWLLGTALAVVRPPNVGKAVRVAAAAIYVPLVFLFSKFHALPGAVSDYLFAVITFFFLWMLLSAREECSPETVFTKGSRLLARFSYTLYVVHIPFIVLLVSLLASDERWIPDSGHILKGLGVLVLTLVYAYVIASMTEFRTNEVRLWMERRLGLTRG